MDWKTIILLNREERNIIKKIKINSEISTTNITAELKNVNNKVVFAEIVRNVLERADYHCRLARRNPYIPKINRNKQLKFAKKHLDKTEEFFDESKYNIFSSNNRHVWKHLNFEYKVKNTWSIVRTGIGNALVWIV